MTKTAILFGSIGSIVETSELQRDAFNRAFREANLDWEWTPDAYRQLLAKSGGRQRIADYAHTRGETVDAEALHARKTEIFDQTMIAQGLALRPGVSDVIAHARNTNVKVAFVTTTSRENVDAIFQALGDQIDADDFAFIADASLVSAGKPKPDIYNLALKALGADASECVAIEDTGVSAQAAQSAGITTVGFPGAYAQLSDFDEGVRILDTLDYDTLVGSA